MQWWEITLVVIGSIALVAFLALVFLARDTNGENDALMEIEQPGPEDRS